MTSTARHQISVERLSKNLEDMYTHDLQLYQNVPLGEIMLHELQEICEIRLKVLTLVERVHLKKLTLPLSQRKTALVKELQKEGLYEFARLVDGTGCKSQTDADIRARRRDHVSYFVLRSAIAFDMWKKRWFYKQETRLFKWRFSSLDDEGIQQFMRINNLELIPISQSEKEDLKEHLQVSCLPVNVDSVQFYKVPFSHVISLVRKRKVFITQGKAFVPEKEILFVFISYFRKFLLSSFESAREVRANLYDDERFTRLFTNLENSIQPESTILVQEPEVKKFVSLDQLDQLSETSYPLCMRVLHKALRKNHHLTYGGRVQYGLFLKGIGISLSDAMEFWKKEFTKVMNEAAFNKEHSYQIRFTFGWEGSRRDYQPYPCLKIIESIVGPRDYHGCPFKHMLHDILNDELTDCGLNVLERSMVLKLSKDGQYSAACNKYYEIRHGRINDTLLRHPNIYFNESMKLHILYRDRDFDPEIEEVY